MKVKEITKNPFAILPIVLAIGALTLPYFWVLVLGPDPTGDEGGAAHLWQLLMVAQMVAIAFFFLTNFSKNSQQTLIISAIQITAFLLAAAPVFLLHL